MQLGPLILHYFRKWFLGRTPRQAFEVTFRMPAVRFNQCSTNQINKSLRSVILERRCPAFPYWPQYQLCTVYWHHSSMSLLRLVCASAKPETR